jgi:predicted GNAT superfamily acetyltransferase
VNRTVTPRALTFRDLATLDEFAQVVELERHIWGPGYDEVVPVPILAVSVHRGGILIGAFEEARMVGFVYSLPGIKDGKPTQWSHMAGVVAEYRSAGLGRTLKMLQRERALAMGLDLIEWTYDPLQAMNAHLNFNKLGVMVEEYAVNLYGESSSPLHRGNPTDRFVAEWWIRTTHVERRLNASGPLTRPHEIGGAPHANRAAAGAWLECMDVDLTLSAPRVTVEIPMGFTEMLSGAPDSARRWRLATRDIFTAYFARSYRVVEFWLDREARTGAYLLTIDG